MPGRLGQHPPGEVDAAGDGGPAQRRAQGAAERRGPALGVGLAGDARPGEDEALVVDARPLDVGEADGAQRPALDRLHDHRVGDGVAVALALQAGLVLVDGAGHVHGEHEQHVHGGVLRPRGAGSEGRCGGDRRGPEESPAPHRRPRVLHPGESGAARSPREITAAFLTGELGGLSTACPARS